MAVLGAQALVAGNRVELLSSEHESDMLPLHHPAIYRWRSYATPYYALYLDECGLIAKNIWTSHGRIFIQHSFHKHTSKP